MLPNVTPTSPAMTAMSAGDRLRKSRTDASVDRKSTRLNSSHDQISYAVFCLKKKNIHNQYPTRTTTRTPAREEFQRLKPSAVHLHRMSRPPARRNRHGSEVGHDPFLSSRTIDSQTYNPPR